MIQSGGFLGRLPVRLMKVSLLSVKYFNTLLTKSVLNTLGLTAAAADTDFEQFWNQQQQSQKYEMSKWKI